jgi:hypothetical protein
VDIADLIAAVQERVRAAATRAGSDPAGITLIGAAKTMPAELVAAAVRAGLGAVGENRVQEGEAHRAALDTLGLRPQWHYIGELQRNKARAAAATFDCVQSIDSTRLAERIDSVATGPIEVLIEVNLGQEPAKAGASPEPAALDALAEACARSRHLRLRGLMAVPPAGDRPEDSRPWFRQLAALARGLGLPDLSMGMTGDFEVAIEEGATMVRVGRAIFGERPSRV